MDSNYNEFLKMKKINYGQNGLKNTKVNFEKKNNSEEIPINNQIIKDNSTADFNFDILDNPNLMEELFHDIKNNNDSKVVDGNINNLSKNKSYLRPTNYQNSSIYSSNNTNHLKNQSNNIVSKNNNEVSKDNKATNKTKTKSEVIIIFIHFIENQKNIFPDNFEDQNSN